MWKRDSACRNLLTKLSTLLGSLFHCFHANWIATSLFLFLATSLLPPPAAAEQIITKIIVNQEEKGDFFIDRTDTGDFLVKAADLKNMGFREPAGTVVLIEGEPYIVLRSLAGADFVFDENSLALLITASPDMLGRKIIDFQSQRAQKVYYPKDSSFFLNYGFDYQAGDRFSFASLNVANQLGIRKGEFLFQSDSAFINDKNHERFVRLQSALIHDDRSTLQRFIAGDLFASSGELGSSLNLGGVSLSKVYRIDPYFINYPTINLSGQVALPSEANIYLNGMQVRTERLSPGQFELRNMSYYGGAGVIDVVIKDMFGREQRLNYPFYFGDSFLLKQGLHEYSYNLGFTRERFGTESDRYSKPAFSAFHRYGVKDFLTLGYTAEAKNQLYNLGSRATLLAGRAGIVSLALAGSTGRGSNTGGAGLATYLYQGLHAGARFSLAGFTRNYTTIATETALDKLKYQASAGVSYSSRLLGSLSFEYTVTKKHLGQDLQTAAIGYNRSLTQNTTITATYRRTKEQDVSNDFFVSVNYTPKFDLFVSASYQATKAVKTELVEVQKNPPVGEGFGYRAALGRADAAGQTTHSVSPSLQYNARFGTYRGDYSSLISSGQTSEQYHLSAAGALVFVGNTFGLTRPVFDSFGLVQVGNLEGIKVLVNSQEIGTTDSSGKVFVPSLGSYYENQVAISDKEIPIEYYLSSVVKLVSPPLRSGSCIPFIAKKMQPLTGRLKIKVNGDIKPVEFHEVTLDIGGKELNFPTGTGGEFDIDVSQSEEFKKMAEVEESGCASLAKQSSSLIIPGSYKARIMYQGKQYTFDLKVPSSTEPIVDLGQIVIEAAPEAAKEPSSSDKKGIKPTQPAEASAHAAAVAQQPVPRTAIKAKMISEPTMKKPLDAGKHEDRDFPPIETAQEGTSTAQINVLAAEETALGETVTGKGPIPFTSTTDNILPDIEVFFRFDSIKFSSAHDREALLTARRLLETHPDYRIIIEGHTDQVGSQAYNRRLGKDRALAVARFFRNEGSTTGRIKKIKSYGKKNLKCSTMDESCRKQNRRGVIRFISDKSDN